MPKHIYLMAGEASGDFLGAQLMKAIKSQAPDTIFSGVGGDLMIEQGLESLFPMNDLSVMGIAEVLPRLRLILKRIKQTTDNIGKNKPDIVVSIDAPDFCFRVIKGVRKRAGDPSQQLPKFVHYVAPTVWAWRPKRAAKIAQFLDAQICLFDFEPPYFEKEGLKAISVGHPMMESGIKQAKPAIIGDVDTAKIGLFFGSRGGEIKRISPTIIEAAQKIANDMPKVEFIVPTLPHLQDKLADLLKDIDAPIHIETNKDNKWSTFKACDVAIAVSGTVGLELSAANVPHVIAYRMNSITAKIVRHLIQTPYAHLSNIMLDKEAVPEFIQDECDPDDIANEVLSLLENESYQRDQTDDFIKVRERIGSIESPSDKAADFILNL